MIVIYKITSPSERIYIGQSWNWETRLPFYRTGNVKGQIGIYNSIQKYGFTAHKVDIMEEFEDNITQEFLDSREIYWWKYYKDLGYEMLNARYPGSRGKRTKESIEQGRQKLTGRKLSEEHHLKMIEINTSLEQREKRRTKLLEHAVSLETRQKITAKLKEKWSNGDYSNRKERLDKNNKIRKNRNGFVYQKVIMRCENGEIYKIFDNHKECANFLGISPDTIIDYISKNLFRRGFYFEYQKENS